MTSEPIATEQRYLASLRRLEVIFDADPTTPDGYEAELLTILIQSYERETYPVDCPDPAEAIRIRME
jgi:HTH-type transcriptional regulator/antitoxin HigA